MSDPKINIHAEFTANTQAGEKANAVLAQTTQQANAAAAATAKLNTEGSKSGGLGKFAQLKAEFAEAGGGLKGFMSVLLGSGATVAAWAAGIAGAFALAAKGLQVFAEKQQQVAKLDAVLANQGKLTDEYREKLQALAGAQAKATATSGNDWLQALTTLNKFGADTSNIDQYTEAVKNLAGFMEGGIPEAAFLFGKAMQGQHQMLTRYGIEVDSSKTRTEQLADIMRQAAEKGGGVLEARAQTITGQFDAFNGAVKKLFGGLGNLISQSGLLQAGLAHLTYTLNLLGKMFPAAVPAADGLKNSLSALSPEAQKATASLKELAGIDAGDMGGVTKSAETAAAALGKELAAMNAIQAKLDQQGDAELQEKLAGIDQSEAVKKAAGQLTETDRAAFEKQRGEARRANERRKLEREQGSIAVAREAAEGDAADAEKRKADFERRTQPQLGVLKQETEDAARQAGLTPGQTLDDRRRQIRNALFEARAKAEGAVKRFGGEGESEHVVRDAEADAKVAALEKAMAGLDRFANASQAYKTAKEKADAYEKEKITPAITAAEQAKAEIEARQRAADSKARTLGITDRTARLSEESSLRRAGTQDRANQAEALGATAGALAGSSDRAITPQQRAQAQATEAMFKDFVAYLKAALEEDPNKRRTAAAGLANTNQQAAAGAALAQSQEVTRSIESVGPQLLRALGQQGQVSSQLFQRMLSLTEQQRAELARQLQRITDQATRNRPGGPGGY